MRRIPPTNTDELRWLFLLPDLPWEEILREHKQSGMVAAVKKLRTFAPKAQLSTLLAAIVVVLDGLVDPTLPIYHTDMLRDQVDAAILTLLRDRVADALDSLEAACKFERKEFPGVQTTTKKCGEVLDKICHALSEVNVRISRDPADAWEGARERRPKHFDDVEIIDPAT